MSRRTELVGIVWNAIDPSMEGVARTCAEQAKQAILSAPRGLFADEITAKTSALPPHYEVHQGGNERNHGWYYIPSVVDQVFYPTEQEAIDAAWRADEIARLTEALDSMGTNITLRSHHKALWLKIGQDRLDVLRQAQ